MNGVLLGLGMLVYGAIFALAAVAVLAAPFYIAFELSRSCRRVWQRRTSGQPARRANREHVVRALREQYAGGALSVGDFETRVDQALTSNLQGELSSALAELPRGRRRLSGAEAFDLCIGLVLLVVARSVPELAFGVLLCLGTLVEARGRVPIYAFLAGLAVLVAPFAAPALAASAVRRWLDERRF